MRSIHDVPVSPQGSSAIELGMGTPCVPASCAAFTRPISAQPSTSSKPARGSARKPPARESKGGNPEPRAPLFFGNLHRIGEWNRRTSETEMHHEGGSFEDHSVPP